MLRTVNDPDPQKRCAEIMLSKKQFEKYLDDLFKIAPNPFEIGRKHEAQKSEMLAKDVAAKLIWC